MAKIYQVRTFKFFSLRITNEFFVIALRFSLNNNNNKIIIIIIITGATLEKSG